MMRKLMLLLAACLAPAVADRGVTAEYCWQQPKVEVLSTGDLEWQPQTFVFEKGDSIRYIDFVSGSDANDGRTKQTPWKHHPWDPAAAQRAAACKGIHTYIFKRGVTYRGQLVVSESGDAGDPIRLTSDPSWGEGEAVICGSERVTGWTLGAKHPDIPNASRVAWFDLDFAPRNVWFVEAAGQIVRIPLARTASVNSP